MRVTERSWFAWASIALLAALCGGLAFVQYRWIGEISGAELEQLHKDLQSRLDQLSAAFNKQLEDAASGLVASSSEIERLGRERAYAIQYRNWGATHPPLFSGIYLAISNHSDLDLKRLNFTTGDFEPHAWPQEWGPKKEQLLARLSGERFGAPMTPDNVDLIEIPRFERTPDTPGPGHEQEWLLLEVNLGYTTSTLIPQLLKSYLSDGTGMQYDAAVFSGGYPGRLIYESAKGAGNAIAQSPDALVDLYRSGRIGPGGAPAMGRGPVPRGGPRPDFPARDRVPARFPGAGRGRGPFGPDANRWRLFVRHRAGSLEAIVSRARRLNIAVSTGALLLILATAGLLLRLSRQQQHLAAVQMNFVAGVSHELRTPLAVIRTAAFNLQKKIASRPDQVERYGKLIHDEAQKLSALVEQVLLFARARSTKIIGERHPVLPAGLIENGIAAGLASHETSHYFVEKHIEPGLPPVEVDEIAMTQALRNLIDNAIKYGRKDDPWIGVYASVVAGGAAPEVEIRVADRGPGIPPKEQAHIFDAFFRGRRALEDQIHGTGLGLNLAKRIIEAHGGTITAQSAPSGGAEFVVRLPTAQREPAIAHAEHSVG